MHQIPFSSSETLTSPDDKKIILLGSLDKNEREIRKPIQKYL